MAEEANRRMAAKSMRAGRLAFVVVLLAGVGAVGCTLVAAIYFGVLTLPALGMNNSPTEWWWLYTLWSLPLVGSLAILASLALAWRGRRRAALCCLAVPLAMAGALLSALGLP
jgi:hypothetical protein